MHYMSQLSVQHSSGASLALREALQQTVMLALVAGLRVRTQRAGVLPEPSCILPAMDAPPMCHGRVTARRP